MVPQPPSVEDIANGRMTNYLPFREIRQRAESGEILAQIMLGFLLEHGLKMSPNKDQAKGWYERAAEQGSPAGQYALAGLIEEDEPKEMMKWLRKAADADFPPAQFRLGWYLELGQIVDRDLKGAVQWVRRAADAGFIPAMTHLSYMYEEGVGVEADHDVSMKYIRRAADAGYAGAAYRLGMELIEQGDAYQEEALELIWKAAQDGQEFANMFLFQMYSAGRFGAAKDERLAKYFLEKSKLTLAEYY